MNKIKDINIPVNIDVNTIGVIYGKHRKGFTLIEVVVYCAIFVIFAVYAIESMIWINSKMSLQDSLTEIRKNNVYKIYFANTYNRYKMDNPKIKNLFLELISSSSITYPSLKEDKDMGLILNQIKSELESEKMTGAWKEKYKVILFDSIDNGV